MRKIVITGAAGLVGQNLVAALKTRPDVELLGIDKHRANIELFRTIHPGVPIIEADLAVPGEWQHKFKDADAVIVNQAQIGGLDEREFWRNNVDATKTVLDAIAQFNIPYFVGISSSVVRSKADDFYTRTKTAQEKLFDASPIPHATLRPTLMFGWFDRKHLGWLRRFMEKTPVFPIPGTGKFQRQPLFAGDFVSVIIAAVDKRIVGTFDISGQSKITYGELIEEIHSIVRPRARIVRIPYRLFWGLLWTYALFDRNPPFTVRQLEALVIPETFPVIDWPQIFDVPSTPLRDALTRTFLDARYGNVALEF